jgi:hypothetical protein
MKPAKPTKKTNSIKTPSRQNAVNAAPAVAPKAPAATIPDGKLAKPTRALPTTIEAHIDVGFGNQLYVRGQGPGLSWERGVPLKNVDPNTWQWSAAATDKLTFKLLINDSVWAQGADVTAAPGQKVEITPSF